VYAAEIQPGDVVIAMGADRTGINSAKVSRAEATAVTARWLSEDSPYRCGIHHGVACGADYRPQALYSKLSIVTTASQGRTSTHERREG
jgi:hypothetical protein